MSTHRATSAASLSPGAAATSCDDDRRLYTLMLWGYFSLFPFTVMFIAMAAVANSSAVIVYTVQSAISITVQTFSIFAIRQVLGANTFRFPYGAGKLEDFSAFLCGVLYVPSGVYMAYDASMRILHPQDVGYVLSMIPIALSATRMVILYIAVRRLARQTRVQSPLLRAYLLDYRVGVLSDAGVLTAFAIGWLLVHSGLVAMGDRVDPIIGLVISLYMIWVGVSLVRRNFSALMDLPLPEDEQLRIMKVLAAHYKEYETIGTLYSRASGKLRFVEIELAFPGESTIARIEALSKEMERSLAEELPGLSFRIIPMGAAE
jgi:cation diffusion facilitator family transporter